MSFAILCRPDLPRTCIDLIGHSLEEKFEKWMQSPPDMARKQHDMQSLRKVGTGEWLLNSEEFVQWQDNSGSLWIQGPCKPLRYPTFRMWLT